MLLSTVKPLRGFSLSLLWALNTQPKPTVFIATTNDFWLAASWSADWGRIRKWFQLSCDVKMFFLPPACIQVKVETQRGGSWGGKEHLSNKWEEKTAEHSLLTISRQYLKRTNMAWSAFCSLQIHVRQVYCKFTRIFSFSCYFITYPFSLVARFYIQTLWHKIKFYRFIKCYVTHVKQAVVVY